jgi:hypothetical protein
MICGFDISMVGFGTGSLPLNMLNISYFHITSCDSFGHAQSKFLEIQEHYNFITILKYEDIK